MARFHTPLGFLLLFSFFPQFAFSQLNVLSSGNPALQWKSTQLQLIEQQMQDPAVKGQLRGELEAQKRWPSEWKSGALSDKPWMTPTEKNKLFTEPTIDPQKKASALRERLLGKGATPTEKDTKELQALLTESPQDLGLKQLYLHWLDQRQYRDQYADAIVESALALAGDLEQGKQTEAVKLARAFCLYRAARSLIHRESDEAVAKKPIEDLAKHESQLLGIYAQLGELVGHKRPEFILLEIRMLRRDGWYGRALQLLEENADVIETHWYLNQRRDLLGELGWAQPAEEAKQIASAYPSKGSGEIRSASRPDLN